MARGVVFACASALANAFSRYDNISERELDIYVRTEYEAKLAVGENIL